MRCTEILKARVSPEIKRQARAIAGRQLLSEAAWLKRLVILEIGEFDVGPDPEVRRPTRTHGRGATRDSRGCLKPVYVRLRDEDLFLLQARAAARGLRPATYVSVLTRSHLRSLAPLPKDELMALKHSITQLAAIGRNLNQIARAANQGAGVGSLREDLRAFLRVCEAMRDNTKGLLKANVTSWEIGHTHVDL